MDYLGSQDTDASIRSVGNEVLSYRKTAASRGYSIAINCSAPITLVLAANTIRAYPWVITKAITISAIFNEVTTLVAGATFRTAIYTDNNLYPGNLVAGSDPGTYDGATVGVKTLSTAITLKPGLYWVASNSSNAPTVRAIPVAAIAPVLGMSLTLGANANTTGYAIASTYAPLPTTFPAGAGFSNNVAAPLTMFQVA